MKLISGTSVLALALALGASAWAQDGEPSADAIKKASSEFSQGKAAYRDADYVEAAEHFEAADETAPSVNALRAAMTSRHKAGQLDRAATEAALALTLYPEDQGLREEADAIIAEADEALFKLTVSCDEPCRLVVGTSLVHGAPASSRVIYLTPGSHAVRASWSEQRGTVTEQVKAEAGAEGALEFQRPEAGDAQESEGTAPPEEDVGDIEMDEPDEDAEPEREPRQGWSPVVFGLGAALTAGLGAATAVSGIDTQKNPGKERVERACNPVRTPECMELYDQGNAKELRTNILAGATAGIGLVTILVGVVATDWGGKKKAESARVERRWSRIEPWIGVGSGVTLGASGRF